jgi:hypothetical protein
VLAVRGEPVEVLGAVMHRVESPEKLESMAGAVEPVNEHVAEHDRCNGLEPDGLLRDSGPDPAGHVRVRPLVHESQGHGRKAGPDQVLAEEEASVDAPRGPEPALPRPRRASALERREDQGKDPEAREARAERGERHDPGFWAGGSAGFCGLGRKMGPALLAGMKSSSSSSALPDGAAPGPSRLGAPELTVPAGSPGVAVDAGESPLAPGAPGAEERHPAEMPACTISVTSAPSANVIAPKRFNAVARLLPEACAP